MSETKEQEKVTTLGKKLYSFSTNKFVEATSEANENHEVETREEGKITWWCIAETEEQVIKAMVSITQYQVRIIDRMSRDIDLLYVAHPEIFTNNKKEDNATN